MPLTDKQRATFSADLRRAMARVDPAWTGANAHDPGLTTLEVLAYALDDLLANPLSPDAARRAVALRIARMATQLAAKPDDAGGTCDDLLTRVRYFSGQMLGVDDFSAEQQYFRTRLARRNRWMHGAGVVGGLELSVERSATGDAVRVEPGLALDPAGEEIHVGDTVLMPLDSSESHLFVLIRFHERPCNLQLMGTGDTADSLEPGRIAETFILSTSTVTTSDAVTLGRLLRRGSRWRVDPRFKARRVR